MFSIIKNTISHSILRLPTTPENGISKPDSEPKKPIWKELFPNLLKLIKTIIGNYFLPFMRNIQLKTTINSGFLTENESADHLILG